MISAMRQLTFVLAVLLQAMKQDPPADAKCRDKFLVQSVALTADKEFSNIGNIVWFKECTLVIKLTCT